MSNAHGQVNWGSVSSILSPSLSTSASRTTSSNTSRRDGCFVMHITFVQCRKFHMKWHRRYTAHYFITLNLFIDVHCGQTLQALGLHWSLSSQHHFNILSLLIHSHLRNKPVRFRGNRHNGQRRHRSCSLAA